jgi:hypothetical protein
MGKIRAAAKMLTTRSPAQSSEKPAEATEPEEEFDSATQTEPVVGSVITRDQEENESSSSSPEPSDGVESESSLASAGGSSSH